MRKTRFSSGLVYAWILGLSVLATAAPNLSFAFPARFGLSPDNSKGLLVSTLKAATQSLQINIYQFDNPEITDAIVDRIRAGIAVSLLVEGQPLGNVSADGRQTLLRIRDEMAAQPSRASHLYIMTDVGNSVPSRRYKYDHAKYVVIDGITALITSENFTATGHPVAGQIGNRGWEAELFSPELAAQLLQIYNEDTTGGHADITEIGPGQPIPTATHGSTPPPIDPNNPFPFNGKAVNSGPRPIPALPGASGDVASTTLILSPNSLAGLVNVIRSAQKDLELEFMSLPSSWRNGSNVSSQNPLVTELIQAARRGVNVRVLLNDDAVFSPGGSSTTARRPNELTARALLAAARCYHVQLDARIVDVKQDGISYIHNKGIIVDGLRAMISSVNGTQNSVMNNREVAVVLESPDAARYFAQAFDFDWRVSPALSSGFEPTSCPGIN